MQAPIRHYYKLYCRLLLNGLVCISQLAQEHACSIPLFGTSMQPIEPEMTCQAM